MLRSRKRGFTLVELLVALTIVMTLSTAIAALLVAAGKTNQYVNDEADRISQVENAYRRMLHNIRTASSMSSPSNTTLTNTFTVNTQPDTGYPSGATVTYAISNGNLVETDSRYGTSILVPQITTFSVRKINSSGTPTTLSISIVAGSPAVTRSATILCRNF